jgi:hypothetical protein
MGPGRLKPPSRPKVASRQARTIVGGYDWGMTTKLIHWSRCCGELSPMSRAFVAQCQAFGIDVQLSEIINHHRHPDRCDSAGFTRQTLRCGPWLSTSDETHPIAWAYPVREAAAHLQDLVKAIAK